MQKKQTKKPHRDCNYATHSMALLEIITLTAATAFISSVLFIFLISPPPSAHPSADSSSAARRATDFPKVQTSRLFLRKRLLGFDRGNKKKERKTSRDLFLIKSSIWMCESDCYTQHNTKSTCCSQAGVQMDKLESRRSETLHSVRGAWWPAALAVLVVVCV